jgi:hypothetical protein
MLVLLIPPCYGTHQDFAADNVIATYAELLEKLLLDGPYAITAVLTYQVLE